ncbi:MAG: hypothetical protein ACRC7O_19210, partial [Fimbriiglobus sp.]
AVGALSGNSSTQNFGNGGGGIFQSGGDTKLSSVSIINNTAVTQGGFAEVGNGTFDLNACTLNGNQAPAGKGPKVFKTGNPSITGPNNDGFDPALDVDS